MLDTKQDRKEFAVILGTLWTAYPNARPLDEVLRDLYWRCLADLDLADLREGAARAVRESKFFPTIAELRNLAGAYTPAQRAVLAWPALRKAGRALKGRSLFVFDDPTLTAVVSNLGGCKRFVDAPSEDREDWLRREFERVYTTLAGVSASGEWMLEPLAGTDRIKDRWEGDGPAVYSDEVKVWETKLPWVRAGETQRIHQEFNGADQLRLAASGEED